MLRACVTTTPWLYDAARLSVQRYWAEGGAPAFGSLSAHVDHAEGHVVEFELGLVDTHGSDAGSQHVLHAPGGNTTVRQP